MSNDRLTRAETAIDLEPTLTLNYVTCIHVGFYTKSGRRHRLNAWRTPVELDVQELFHFHVQERSCSSTVGTCPHWFSKYMGFLWFQEVAKLNAWRIPGQLFTAMFPRILRRCLPRAPLLFLCATSLERRSLCFARLCGSASDRTENRFLLNLISWSALVTQWSYRFLRFMAQFLMALWVRFVPFRPLRLLRVLRVFGDFLVSSR